MKHCNKLKMMENNRLQNLLLAYFTVVAVSELIRKLMNTSLRLDSLTRGEGEIDHMNVSYEQTRQENR